MRICKKFVVFFILTAIFICSPLHAQIDNVVFNIPGKILPADSNKMFISIENGTYFKNNYYYNNFEVGYKEIGFFLQPELVYYPTGNTKFSAGLHLLKYAGLENFTRNTPVLSFQYNIVNGLNLVLGTLYGTTNHRLIEPIFMFDRYNQNHVENGFQLLIDKKHLWADLWLNWEKFIFDRSSIQERFTVGISSKYTITAPESNLQIKLPLQLLTAHRGGMHTVINAHVQTLFNFVYGLELDYKLNVKMFQNFAFRGYAAHFSDLSVVKEEPFRNGYGLYPNFLLEGKLLDIMLGYWNANRFIAPRGEYLFQSVSKTDSSYTEANRQLLNCKLALHHTIASGIEIGLRLESFYDLKNKNFDYNYSLFITFNRELFLRKFD